MSRSMLRSLRDGFTAGLRTADDYVGQEAFKRSLKNSAAGERRNRARLMLDSPDAVAAMVGDRMGMDSAAVNDLRGVVTAIDAMNPRARRVARAGFADEYAAQLPRGPMGMTQMGPMEAINAGIAGNRYVRRGVLPTAIAGGGLMAGAAVTTGAQNLMALMEFMRGGAAQQERTEQSPLIG